MNPALIECRAARVPRAAWASLGSLRCRRDLQIIEMADSLWIQWESEPLPVVETLLPIPGAIFYRRRHARWCALGAGLPDFADPFPGKPLPSSRVIQPAPFTPLPIP